MEDHTPGVGAFHMPGVATLGSSQVVPPGVRAVSSLLAGVLPPSLPHAGVRDPEPPHAGVFEPDPPHAGVFEPDDPPVQAGVRLELAPPPVQAGVRPPSPRYAG